MFLFIFALFLVLDTFGHRIIGMFVLIFRRIFPTVPADPLQGWNSQAGGSGLRLRRPHQGSERARVEGPVRPRGNGGGLSFSFFFFPHGCFFFVCFFCVFSRSLFFSLIVHSFAVRVFVLVFFPCFFSSFSRMLSPPPPPPPFLTGLLALQSLFTRAICVFCRTNRK